MLALVRNANPYTAILLLLYAIICRLPALTNPQGFVPASDHHILYNLLMSVISTVGLHNAFLLTLLCVLSTFAQALFLNRIAQRSKLFLRSGYVVAFVFLSLTALQVEFSYFSKAHFVIWLYLMALQCLLKLPGSTTPRKIIFNAAFILSCWWVLQFSGILMFTWFVLCLLLLRPFKLNEWVVGLMGWIAPVYFFACGLLLSDHIRLIKKWPVYSLNLPTQLPDKLYMYVLVGSLVLLAIMGIMRLNFNLSRIPVEIRRKWMAVHISMVIVFITTLLADNSLSAAWLLPLAPLSLMVALNLATSDRGWLNNFVFYFIVTLVIFALNYNWISKIII